MYSPARCTRSHQSKINKFAFNCNLCITQCLLVEVENVIFFLSINLEIGALHFMNLITISIWKRISWAITSNICSCRPQPIHMFGVPSSMSLDIFGWLSYLDEYRKYSPQTHITSNNTQWRHDGKYAKNNILLAVSWFRCELLFSLLSMQTYRSTPNSQTHI